MAIDSDPLAIKLQHSKQELTAGIEQQLAATAAGVLSMIPGVGSAIQSLLEGRARERVERRWVELFEDRRERIEAVRDRIPDPHYYGSEEFQTLLALAWEQLMTTHDHAKLHMLAAALANSGRAEFEGEDKELYVRTLREFSLPDLLFLRKLVAGPSGYNNAADDEHDEAIARMSRLLGAGLVKEQSIPANEGSVTRIFQLSGHGKRFLAFVEAENPA